VGEFVFTQLGGEKLTLSLAGAFAPHGRPRQRPVVVDAVSIRNTEVYYPGNAVPTRHLFGTREEPWELNGRFSDRNGGPEYARTLTEYVKRFVADQQQVRIAWNGIVAANGFIESFEPGRESAAEVAWRMTIRIDEDLLRVIRKRDPVEADPKTYVLNIQDYIDEAWDDALDIPPTLKVGLIDSLGSLIGSINSAVASVAKIADQMNSFQQGLVSELRRLRAGLRQLRTSVIKARNAYADLVAGTAVVSSNSDDSLAFWNAQGTTGAAMLSAILEIERMDAAAREAERGKIKGVYVARDGDTWESIAQQTLGSAERAADIRNANGATGNPVPGTEYIIPR
jgi:hypothetical protein